MSTSVIVKFHPAGEIERAEDGSIAFPNGGSLELGGVERRVKPGDLVAVRIDKDGFPVLLINGVPATEILLDS